MSVLYSLKFELIVSFVGKKEYFNYSRGFFICWKTQNLKVGLLASKPQIVSFLNSYKYFDKILLKLTPKFQIKCVGFHFQINSDSKVVSK